MSIKRRRRGWFFFLTVALLLVGVRLLLPTLLCGYLNRALATRPDYRGSISDVDISLWDGGYIMKGLVVTQGEEVRPLLKADAVVVGLAWDTLLDGALVANVEMWRPEVSWVQGSSAGHVDWYEELSALVPLPIDNFVVEEGDLHYLELAGSGNPIVDIHIADLALDARNFENTLGLPPGLVATVDITGRPADLGQLRLHADVDPFAATPTFKADAQVKGVPLSRLQGFVRAHSAFDVKVGTLELAFQMAVGEGGVEGTIKPSFKGLKALDLRSVPGESPTRSWREMAAGAKGILETDGSQKTVLTVPVAAHLPGGRGKTWAAVGTATGRALVEALFRGIENEADRLDQVRQASTANKVAKPRMSRVRAEDAQMDVVAEAEEERPKRKLFARKQRLATTLDRRGR